MDFTNDISKIKELLAGTQDVLIVTHEKPTFDSMGSALALSLGLAGFGKKVTVACPDQVTVELSSFIGVDKVVTDLASKNFVISLDYIDGSIEKVSYNIEGNKFNLVIEPRAGFETFSSEKVHFTHAGSTAGLIITIDTIHLGGLKKLYEEDKELFAGKPIVNVDHHANNALYGHTNMVDPQASSTAEVVSQLMTGLGIVITEDIATNLVNAIYGATNNFQSANVSPGAFEAMAGALKVGGKRFANSQASEDVMISQPAPVVAPPVPAVKVTPSVQPAKPANVAAPVASVQAEPAAPVKPMTAPPDWLKPKIFKSSNLS